MLLNHTEKSMDNARIKSKETGFMREAALYLDFYGGLLTDRQVEILDLYYNEDYSLSEIAQGLHISRQAAHDALKSGTRALAEYEEKLGLARAYQYDENNSGEARAALAEARATFAEACVTLAELRDAIAQLRAAAIGAGLPDIERQIGRLDNITGRIEKVLTKNSK
jgi:predicted DNA-binding protein YlxM (UPF0122 family)